MEGAFGPPQTRRKERSFSLPCRPTMTKNVAEIVFVIDDDESIREALNSLLRSVGLSVQTFASAHDFLTSSRPDVPFLFDTRRADAGTQRSRSSSRVMVIFRCQCVR